jgi:hypothetical protein
MYIYWRIQHDLTCLGETIQFHDPRFIRNFEKWIREHTSGIILAEEL